MFFLINNYLIYTKNLHQIEQKSASKMDTARSITSDDSVELTEIITARQSKIDSLFAL